MHTIHHEKIYIQCYKCNNWFMHKGQDQVNILEVYSVNPITFIVDNILQWYYY